MLLKVPLPISWLQPERRDGAEHTGAPSLCRHEPNTCTNTDTSEVCTAPNKAFLPTVYSQAHSLTAYRFGWDRQQTVTGGQPIVHIFFWKNLTWKSGFGPLLRSCPMLPIVISPTNSRLGHLLMTCSTAAAVSPGGRPCLPGKKQGDLCQALPETSPPCSQAEANRRASFISA